ncbi:hypothetical protein [Bradyrhizobium sp.]|jgi:hypothetical protein|uniref:hypothetical protein n=1 Tax=Bradyrhizobium sp. TaxID=376 RepID=UPI002DDDA77A|nr:hypothetical protein [Bradyrhizobium sp.]HEV2152814.1 hypothetical protein [Bradyrhizobium sp.]
MKYRGVVYDVGLRFTAGQAYSVEPFDPALAAHDIKVIATELHANAIRIEGEEIDRLAMASRSAHAAGLTIFFNPWKMNVPVTELAGYFAQSARVAERLRNEGADIVFVAGCEMTLFNEGILEGSTVMERVMAVARLSQEIHSEDARTLLTEKGHMLNDALRGIVEAVRHEFKGPVTYSAGMWEMVDWSLFDIVGVDHYRSNETPEDYVATLDRYRIGKPLIVMEVGSCAYEGAGVLGAGGFMRLQGTNPDGTGIFTDGIVPTRSEREQSDYVAEQLGLLSDAGISGVFIYVFSFPTFRYREGARDLDMMSFSLVRTYPEDHPISQEMPPWEPKEAFHRIAAIYGNWPSETHSVSA